MRPVEHLLDPASTVEEFTYAGATLVAEAIGAPTGDDASAHPFLLLHGIGMGRSVYIDFVSHLDGRVVALDLPGFGEAPEPVRTLTMERHADLIATWMRASGTGPAVVIGHSMGSQIAAELAARHPDLVAGLVLAGPTVDSTARSIRVQAGLLFRDLLGERPRVLVRGAREYLRGGPNLLRKMRATIVHEPEDAYRRVQCPVLVLRGERDPLASDDWCRTILDLIPGSRLEVIPDHGHGTLISDSGPVAGLVEEFATGL